VLPAVYEFFNKLFLVYLSQQPGGTMSAESLVSSTQFFPLRATEPWRPSGPPQVLQTLLLPRQALIDFMNTNKSATPTNAARLRLTDIGVGEFYLESSSIMPHVGFADAEGLNKFIGSILGFYPSIQPFYSQTTTEKSGVA
jgi:hypothetical protein